MLRVPLTEAMADELEKNKLVSDLEPIMMDKDFYLEDMFPHDSRFQWNLDYFGPIYIPRKGATIDIDLDNLPLYERIIDYYEANDLEVRDSVIYINGKPSSQYTFKMNYYWMMGDNRHRSLDSRFWGYVPEDHIVGKPRFVWLSLNQDKRFPLNIRFRRMFMRIR